MISARLTYDLGEVDFVSRRGWTLLTAGTSEQVRLGRLLHLLLRRARPAAATAAAAAAAAAASPSENSAHPPAPTSAAPPPAQPTAPRAAIELRFVGASLSHVALPSASAWFGGAAALDTASRAAKLASLEEVGGSLSPTLPAPLLGGNLQTRHHRCHYTCHHHTCVTQTCHHISHTTLSQAATLTLTLTLTGCHPRGGAPLPRRADTRRGRQFADTHACAVDRLRLRPACPDVRRDDAEMTPR